MSYRNTSDDSLSPQRRGNQRNAKQASVIAVGSRSQRPLVALVLILTITAVSMLLLSRHMHTMAQTRQLQIPGQETMPKDQLLGATDLPADDGTTQTTGLQEELGQSIRITRYGKSGQAKITETHKGKSHVRSNGPKSDDVLVTGASTLSQTAATIYTWLPQLSSVPLQKLQELYNPASNPRYYDIGSWRHTKPVELRSMVYQQAGELEGDMRFFVRRTNQGLTLGAGRWMMVAAKLPDNATDMAASGAAGRKQLLQYMEEAKQLGFNAIRLVAFKDGHTLPYPLQVAPGILDDTNMREGLDWIVWQARYHDLRVVLVLTSGTAENCFNRGGIAQYIRWFNPEGTINDFFKNDTYKARFFDWMTAVAVRENAFTHIQYRHDPAVLAWDLVEHPMEPGVNTGNELQGWIPYMANFMRRMDPNHLIYVGGQGLFGVSSPHHLELNPTAQGWPPAYHQDMSLVTSPLLHLPPLPTAPACCGLDFLRNSMLQEVDLSVASVLPDTWLACNDKCKLSWTKEWMAAHVRDALRMQKPLLIGQFEVYGPPWRQQLFQQLVLGYLANVTRQGLPIAGVVLGLPTLSLCSSFGSAKLTGWNVTCMQDNKEVDMRPETKVQTDKDSSPHPSAKQNEVPPATHSRGNGQIPKTGSVPSFEAGHSDALPVSVEQAELDQFLFQMYWKRFTKADEVMTCLMGQAAQQLQQGYHTNHGITPIISDGNNSPTVPTLQHTSAQPVSPPLQAGAAAPVVSPPQPSVKELVVDQTDDARVKSDVAEVLLANAYSNRDGQVTHVTQQALQELKTQMTDAVHSIKLSVPFTAR